MISKVCATLEVYTNVTIILIIENLLVFIARTNVEVFPTICALQIFACRSLLFGALFISMRESPKNSLTTPANSGVFPNIRTIASSIRLKGAAGGPPPVSWTLHLRSLALAKIRNKNLMIY